MAQITFANRLIIYLLLLIIALLLSYVGISYVILYILLAFIVTILSNRRLTAVTMGVFYTLLGYAMSLFNGITMSQYLPNDLVIRTEIPNLVSRSIIGLIIPLVVTIIICGLTAILTMRIMKHFNINYSLEGEVHTFDPEESFNSYFKPENESQAYDNTEEEDESEPEEEVIYDPIQRSIMRNKRK